VFEEVLARPRGASDAVYGVYRDGWTAQRVVVTWSRGAAARTLHIELTLPDTAPFDRVTVYTASPGSRGTPRAFSLARAEMLRLTHSIDDSSGALELRVHPAFQPAAHSARADRRVLGCHCTAVRLIGAGGNHQVNLWQNQ
jgi:hypothetical protein